MTLRSNVNYQNTVILISIDPTEKEEYLDMFAKNNDYVEKPNIYIITDHIKYIFVDVKTEKKHIGRRSV